MLVECYDEKGAEVYEMIIKQIFQDLVLGPAVDDLKAFVDPREPVFILAIKMKKTSSVKKLEDVAKITFKKDEDVTDIFVENENYLPNILKNLWFIYSREDIYQPTRFNIELPGDKTDLAEMVIDDPHSNLQRRIYDAVFRILPEGFKVIKDMSVGNIVAVIATDELIKDAWIEKMGVYIDELESDK